MVRILIALGLGYLGAVSLIVIGTHLLAQANGRRYRLEVGRRLAAAARPGLKVETVFRANPAGPAQDALRSAQLEHMFHKTRPEA